MSDFAYMMAVWFGAVAVMVLLWGGAAVANLWLARRQRRRIEAAWRRRLIVTCPERPRIDVDISARWR